MAIGAPWVGTAVSGSAGGTSVTVDATGATVGEWVFVAIIIADSQTSAPTAPSGWTITGQGQEGVSGSASSCLTVYQRRKQSGDTTQAFTWPTTRKFEAVIWSWPGLNPVTPVESVVYLAHSTAGTSYVTGTVTPTSNDRWIGMVAGARGVTALETFTPDAAMTERIDANHGGSTPFTAVEVCDTNGAVTQAGHTYTAVDSVSDPNGGTIAFALIPAVTVNGAATVAGAGTVSAAVTQGAGSATAAAGSLSGSVVQGAGTSPSGAAGLSATVVQGAPAAPVAAGTLAASVTQRSTVGPAGAGVLAALAAQQATVTLAGTSGLVSPAVQGAGAVLAGAGGVSASNVATVNGTAALAGVGSLVAVGTVPGSNCTTARPFTGTTGRPLAGVTARPFTGTTVRPCG